MSERLPQPLPKTGPASQRWEKWREHTKREVFFRVQRTRHGLCEVIGCTNKARDRAHLAGRGHIVAEPFASLPELCEDLRWEGVQRLAVLFIPAEVGQYQPLLDVDPLDCIRQLVTRLEHEYHYDDVDNRIVSIHSEVTA